MRAIVVIRQVLIHPGVDNGGKRSGVMLVGLRGRQCQAGEGEEEALHHEGNGDNDDSYQGKGGERGRWRGRWRGRGKKGKRFI